MDKSPEFDVIERVLNSSDHPDNTEEQLEHSWIDHYISLADRLLSRSVRLELPTAEASRSKKAA